MSLRPLANTLSPATLPLATLRIGLWEDDVAADCIRGDAVMAAMYGLTEAEAEQGLSWAHLGSLFHPDDLDLDPNRHRQVRENGGLFVWEHRILPEPDVVRWVLARGHFERDASGQMRGRGIVIDVTDTRIDGLVDGPAQFLTANETSGAVLEGIADRAMGIFDMVSDLDADGADRLRPLIEAFLHELGRQLAKSLQDELLSPERPPNSKVH
jgi:hypothetical protein